MTKIIALYNIRFHTVIIVIVRKLCNPKTHKVSQYTEHSQLKIWVEWCSVSVRGSDTCFHAFGIFCLNNQLLLL